MTRFPVLRLLLLLLVSSTPALTAAGPLVRVDVVDRDRGQWLPVHPSRGESWIAAPPGHRYGVRLTNTSGERVLVVLSVDGVNAVTGETAHPGQTGYVLAPWQSAEIDGWRKSYQDVAAFVFTALEDSYAARTGRAGNVGTIGVAVFRERAWPPAASGPSPPIARGEERIASRRHAPAAEAAQAHSDRSAGYDAHARQRIGTGHGPREWSPVGQTSFVRASRRPAQVSQLRYDAPHVLAARGILPRGWTDGAAGPRAFPGTFVQDPPGGWR
ncbi:hypothetical protein [Luteimonas kalidii]|uniref:Uncharacterized protein n=1 Tax=Luteimonas kalidii TaxID=3042025 RepID=A0ABT6JXS0_9GAMM|nr:hypothetical protein [Luteimonas kalidii]MDH5835379.1 hypothetical protein [Luteimonas kalidii]